jgi:hypothetical protein
MTGISADDLRRCERRRRLETLFKLAADPAGASEFVFCDEPATRARDDREMARLERVAVLGYGNVDEVQALSDRDPAFGDFFPESSQSEKCNQKSATHNGPETVGDATQ